MFQINYQRERCYWNCPTLKTCLVINLVCESKLLGPRASALDLETILPYTLIDVMLNVTCDYIFTKMTYRPLWLSAVLILLGSAMWYADIWLSFTLKEMVIWLGKTEKPRKWHKEETLGDTYWLNVTWYHVLNPEQKKDIVNKLMTSAKGLYFSNITQI